MTKLIGAGALQLVGGCIGAGKHKTSMFAKGHVAGFSVFERVGFSYE